VGGGWLGGVGGWVGVGGGGFWDGVLWWGGGGGGGGGGGCVGVGVFGCVVFCFGGGRPSPFYMDLFTASFLLMGRVFRKFPSDQYFFPKV